MDYIQREIMERQEYYWLGRKYKEENNLPQAIEAFKKYSTHLADVDKHIPHQWISKYYDILGETDKSLFHLEEFAKGCTPLRAAELYKVLGEKYLKIHSIEKAVTHFENAIANDPKIGVKKLLEELRRSIL